MSRFVEEVLSFCSLQLLLLVDTDLLISRLVEEDDDELDDEEADD